MEKGTPKISINISIIKKRLPYIWNNKHDNGPDFFSGRPIKPDQYGCFDKKYLSEHDCAAILLGIPFPNAAYHFIGRELRKTDNKINGGDFSIPCDLNNTMGLYQLSYIFDEIKQMFELSKEELAPRDRPKITSAIQNEFEKHEFPALYTTPLSGFFETDLLYETQKFIKVAKEYGFPIPVETKQWPDKQTETDAEQIDTNTNQSMVRIYPTPGSTWDQIEIRYVNDSHIEISHPGVKTHTPYSMLNLGLSGKPMLEALFKQFAENRGVINGENMGVQEIKANVSNLRKHLKQIFPNFEGTPIANYNPKSGYVCNFKTSSAH